MPLNVRCPDCGKGYRLRDELAGTRVACKECGGTIAIPAAERRAPSAEDDEFFEPRKKGRRTADEEARDDDSRPRKSGRSKKKTGDDTGVYVVLAVGGGVGLLLCLGLGVLAWHMLSGEKQVANNPAPVNPPPQFPQPAFNPEGNGGFPNPNPVPNPNPGGQAPLPPPVVPHVQPPVNPAAGAGAQAKPLTFPSAPFRWDAKPDPANPPFELGTVAEAQFAPPSERAGNGIETPAVLSPFFCIGANNSPNAKRQIWDVRNVRPAGEIRGRLELSDEITVSPDGKLLAGILNFGKEGIQVWSFATGEKVADLPGGKSFGGAILTFASPSRLVFASKGEKRIDFFDVDGSKKIGEMPVEDFDHEKFAVSPGGRQLVLFMHTSPRIFRFIDVEQGKLLGDLELPKVDNFFDLNCLGLGISPDGKEVAGLFESFNTLYLLSYDVATARLLKQHILPGALRENFPGGVFAKGRGCEYLLDGTGWCLFGSVVVEKDSGAELWRFRGPQAHDAQRALVGGSVIVSLDGNFNQKQVAVTPLAGEKLAEAAAAIRAGGLAIDSRLPKLTPVEWNQVAPRALGAPPNWSAQPDAAPAPAAALTASAVPLKSSANGVRGIAFSLPSAAVAAVFTDLNPPADLNNPKFREQGLRAMVELIDLAQGTAAGAFNLPFDGDLADVSPDGTRLLMRIAEYRDRLDLFDAKTGNHLAGFRPTQAPPGGVAPKILWARFTDDAHVVTFSEAGDLICWQVPEIKPVYAYREASSALPVQSPGRKQIALFTGNSFRLMDALSGNMLGQTPNAAVAGTLEAAAFSSDGAQLAALVGRGVDHALLRYDVAAGSAEKPLPVPVGGATLQFCSPTMLLIGGQHLLDVAKNGVVWRYTLAAGRVSDLSPDGRTWYASAGANGQGPASLLGVKLPHGAAQAGAGRITKPYEPVLQPGSQVAMEYNLGAPAANADAWRRDVATGVLNRIKANGLTEAQGASIRVQVQSSSQDTGKKEKIEIIGLGRQVYDIPIIKIDCRVAVVSGNQVIWEAKQSIQTSVGFFEQIPANEGVEAYFAKRPWGTAQSWFQTLQIPQYLFPAAAYTGMGESRLTDQGPS